MNRLISFRKQQDGAVTVDWVVLTAGVIGFAVFGYFTIADTTENFAATIAGWLADAEPNI